MFGYSRFPTLFSPPLAAHEKCSFCSSSRAARPGSWAIKIVPEFGIPLCNTGHDQRSLQVCCAWHTHKHTHTHTHTHSHTQTHTHTHAHAQARTRIRTHACIIACLQSNVFIISLLLMTRLQCCQCYYPCSSTMYSFVHCTVYSSVHCKLHDRFKSKIFANNEELFFGFSRMQFWLGVG